MNIPLVLLGLYMLAMAIVGYIRTGSPTALYIMGGMALVTGLMSYLAADQVSVYYLLALGWTALISLVVGFMTFKRIAAHANARPGSALIFGSTALFALVVLTLLWLGRPS